MDEFCITFAIEPTHTAKQRRHNTNEPALFDPCTKWTENELPINDLNHSNINSNSSNRITATNERAQPKVHPDTAKFSPFQDVEDIEFKDL